jgi:chemotaxis protein CheD
MLKENIEVLEKQYLLPSQLFASKANVEVSTILGSCVAVCLYDERLKVGGINHYMLPIWNTGLATPKYGSVAMEKLLKKMLEMGCQKSNIIAKVFGGGDVTYGTANMFNIGQRNIDFAFDYLKKNNIRIAAQDCGGNLARKLLFNTKSGIVIQKYITKEIDKEAKRGF